MTHVQHDRWLDVLECGECGAQIPAKSGGSLIWGSELVEFSLAYCESCGVVLQRWEGPRAGVEYYMMDLDKHLRDDARRRRTH